jgi:hypothetical protein
MEANTKSPLPAIMVSDGTSIQLLVSAEEINRCRTLSTPFILQQ